jgi:hemerythrin
MAYFTWEEKYSVGVKAIDEQHKKLIDLINTLYEAMRSGKGKEVLTKTIDSLIDYTKYHFDAEEKLMNSHGYPDVLPHKQEHKKLTDQVIQIQEKYRQGNAAVSVELSSFLKDWLSSHILGTDKKYTKFFNDKGIK